jgi:hypothetical protein
LNLWTGFEFKPKPKPDGYSVFADHLLTNVCEGNERLFQYLFAWFAQMFQRPRERPGVAIVLRGKRGTGKSTVGETFGRLVFQHYYQVDSPTYITGRFNFHLGRCLLLEADEATWAGDKAAEGRLKGLITAPFQMIEPKHIDAARLTNHDRLVMTTNENWAIPAGPDERRFFVLDVNDRCAQHHAYFADMKAQLEDGGYEALQHDLLTFDLTTVNLFEAPKTASLLYQKNRSTDPIASWWKDRLWAGTTLRSADSWDRVVRCTVLFDDYIAAAERVGVGRKAQETIFGIELKRLVPGLGKCRTTIGAGRAWHYKIPPLRDCRDAWDEFMQQPEDWPPEEEDGGDSLDEREASGDF